MIVAAAIRMSNGLVVSMPAPHRHHDIIRMLNDAYARPYLMRGEQGFLDDKGNFRNRIEAAEMAIAEGQLLDDRLLAPHSLYSEDLW